MENKMITINASALPVKTWRYLKINETSIPVPEKVNGKGNISIENSAKNVSVADSNFADAINKISSFTTGKKIKIEGALGSSFWTWFENQNPKTTVFNVTANKSDGTKENSFVRISLKDKDELAKLFIIKTQKESKANFVFDISSEKNTKTGFAAVYIICLLEENSEIKISQSQFLGNSSVFAGNVVSFQKENSRLSVVRGNFGSEKSWIGLKANLEGEMSEIDDQLAYITDGNQTLDINNIATHHGKKTKCNFNGQGVMLGKSYKNYKGTIDFIRGCAASEGSELEDVLLLSDDAINKTTPIILCDEEDVVGNHGATLGKIDENLLFYMESRGIGKNKARQMVANGKLCKVINLIPDEKIVEKALAYIEQVFN